MKDIKISFFINYPAGAFLINNTSHYHNLTKNLPTLHHITVTIKNGPSHRSAPSFNYFNLITTIISRYIKPSIHHQCQYANQAQFRIAASFNKAISPPSSPGLFFLRPHSIHLTNMSLRQWIAALVLLVMLIAGCCLHALFTSQKPIHLDQQVYIWQRV